MRHLFIVVAVALAYPISGQICTCESNFEWVKKTFEENDAGFQYIIDKKGQAAYNIHNQLMLEKIKAAKTSMECTGLLYEWLRFFRSGHIGIERLTNETSAQPSVPQTVNESIAYESWEVDIPQFEKYIETKQESDYEGIWDISGVYKIGIQKEGTNYVGFIIESSVDSWKQGLVKLKIEKHDEKVKTTFYMRDHSSVESGEIEMLSNNYLQIGGQHILKRLSPVFPDDPSVENYLKAINAQNPYLDELNETTLYLRIPSFQIESKPAIDRVLADNKEKILQTENLIIDLRNNGGGASMSFFELSPFLYTNPIRGIGIEFLSTELNNKRSLEHSNNPNFNENTRQWYRNNYDVLQGRLGEFVKLSGEDVTIHNQDTVYDYPKNVGIIIDRGCASATEQFLLNAKQSKKVKLFGTSTYGMLDVANMYSVGSPCREFALHYCLSRSLGLSEMAIDDIGIQPDYHLDKTIPKYKWVEFVNDILNQ